MEIAENIEQITKDFVAVKSVNSTSGEKDAADYLEGRLLQIPYFTDHADQVIRQPLAHDALQRSNIFAYLHGLKSPSNKTILWHGHMDTVGTEDYGRLEPYATNCERLAKELLKIELPANIYEEIRSGDWLVGRGACDMKSGVAVFIGLMEYLSTRLDTFSGNILLSINPVEENQHTGIIEGIKILKQLQKEHNFDYLFAINNDYICPLYEGDTNKYVYMGAVGKLLPCIYIKGCETHVGQCFEGFDASVAAAQLVTQINYNTDFCDNYNGEYTLPPSVLKLKDLKNHYNVQTAQEAFVYFNYFVHAKPTTAILDKLKQKTKRAMQNTAAKIAAGSQAYAQLSSQKDIPAMHIPQVLTFTELLKKAEAKSNKQLSDAILADAQKRNTQGEDKREISLALVRQLVNLLDEHEPLAIIFFAAPYCPYNTLRQELPTEKTLIDRITKIVIEFGQSHNENYQIKQFFPSLSDGSYLKINDDDESLRCLQENMPAMSELYPLPLTSIKSLNIPALNFGCYGKDAHKWSERVYKPYSFSVLPELILKTIYEFL
ncbi:M20/M25/M40 family metallo-hydrolase [Pectinatus brassicae]|uniref:Arginine utilization protein RocB n=1 Tax=Pectinatus brassicae TaxID=862415 RepID=A0A840UV69_9FIRM|nr:M20/M25/M40 family metallo-hydrolase [Pectinatus brassicae]MBB5336714.1 arginine utilization protein RocB [Pectinatus brassicae]